MNKLLTWCLSAALTMMMVACSGQPEKSQPIDLMTESSTPSELKGFDEKVELDVEWRHKVGPGVGSKNYRLRPVVQGDKVFVADLSGRIDCVSLEDGSVFWSLDLDDQISAGVSVADQQVFVATLAGELFALSAEDGHLLWSKQLSSESVAPATTDDEQVYVRTIDGGLMAFARDNGEQRWLYKSALPLLTVHGTSSVTLFEDLVLAGFASGKVMAFDRKLGLPRWDVRLATAQGRSELERLVDVDSAPLVIDDVIYSTSYHGKLSSISGQGATGWQAQSSSYFSPAQGLGNLYVAQASDAVIGYDAYSGNKVWSQPALIGRDIGAPTVQGNYVAVADFAGYVHLLSQIDGEVAGRIRLRPNPIHMTYPNKSQMYNWHKLRGRDFGIRSQLVATDKGLLVLTNIGELFLLSLNTED